MLTTNRTTTGRAPGSLAGPGGPAARSRRRVPQSVWGFLLVLPSLALVTGVVLYPLAYLLWLSVHSKLPFGSRLNFTGLENFQEILSAPEFWRSVWLSVVYAVGSVGLQTVLGIAVALLLHQRFVGRGAIRMISMIPYVLPTIVVTLVWRWLLDVNYGPAEYAARLVGLTDRAVGWMTPGKIMLTLILVSTWTFFPFVMISILARLQTINPSLWEAGMVDGAGAWRRFWHITLPQLRSVLLTLILLRIMFMFTKFDVVFLFAGTGALGENVETLPVLTYIRTFGEGDLGGGAVMALFMFALLGTVSLIYLRSLWREERT
ncbi:MAG: ABC transporter permease subunit [Streptosporangiales bacterium]|nr:ABC transporter permease subunit [Streptosporangiales bacterium]